jgi:hypothetical protein
MNGEHRPNACCDYHRHIADGCCHCENQPDSAENGLPDEWAPWECPRCGKTAQANLTRLGPLGVVRCTCGSKSRATRPVPPAEHTQGCQDWRAAAAGRPCVCHVAKDVPDGY